MTAARGGRITRCCEAVVRSKLGLPTQGGGVPSPLCVCQQYSTGKQVARCTGKAA